MDPDYIEPPVEVLDVSPRRRPKSSPAQIITALITLLGVAVIVVLMVLGLNYVQSVADWYGDNHPVGPPTVAVFQQYCTEYERFVLDQAAAGVSPDRINDLLTRAAHGGDEVHAHGLRLDDPQACGTAANVLQIAGK